MNILEGKITDINTHGSVSLVTLQIGPVSFNTIVIETPDTVSYLKKEHIVKVAFKETEVIIGKNHDHSISIQNKVVAKILDIEKGTLLSKLTLGTSVGKIIAIITTNAAQQLQLHIGEEVTTMIKTTEIMLSQ
ncbi:TOBE domain-containing protein [Aquimarina mytili]|uniref:TOBE domain-containing protein n=1 Tax=Aquimarina mytili TaxID=874423 RepID=A0A937A388_9FLAO|nr:TOBE domain-containing protein [Aquimarina mytili]MBL0683569.1 TOBE domain-containing protein [Aquimarina mytili]